MRGGPDDKMAGRPYPMPTGQRHAPRCICRSQIAGKVPPRACTVGESLLAGRTIDEWGLTTDMVNDR
jgi:hypothetical protein